MAQLAIKGHATRGKEVIEILEMLGGVNAFKLDGTMDNYYYYIDENSNKIYHCLSINPEYGIVYNLEEFEKLYPYKVGDKVTNEYRLPMMIFDIYWDSDSDIIKYKCAISRYDKTMRTGLIAEDSQSYEEENYCQVIGNNTSSNGVNTSASSLNEEPEPEPKAPILSNRYDYAEGKCGYVIPDGYEFDTIKEGFQTEIILKPKKPTYPKDYKECCEVLGIEDDLQFVYENIDGRHINPACISHYRMRKLNLYDNFEDLITCRDAYWKIAGAEMGLDKPWEPDWKSEHEYYSLKHTIITEASEILVGSTIQYNAILAFPTPEMRDAFYENFKEEIEMCKELL